MNTGSIPASTSLECFDAVIYGITRQYGQYVAGLLVGIGLQDVVRHYYPLGDQPDAFATFPLQLLASVFARGRKKFQRVPDSLSHCGCRRLMTCKHLSHISIDKTILESRV